MHLLVTASLELAMLTALAGAIRSAWRSWRGGSLQPTRCAACGRPASHAYASCRRCGSSLP